METIFNNIFTTDGRISRLPYVKYTVLLWIASAVVSTVFKFIGEATNIDSSLLLYLPMWALLIGMSVGNVMLDIRRLHDLNKSGWFCLLMLVPFVNIIFQLYLLFAQGTVGYNRYGEDPLLLQ